MRLFIGTLLRPSNQVLLDRFISDLVRAQPASLRAIPAASAHFTYAFCADADAGAMTGIVQAATRTAGGHTPFEIRLGHPQVVGPRSRPRLVCAELASGEAEFRRLALDLFARLELSCPGLPLSPSRTPHVTLGRFRKPATRQDAERVSHWLTRHGSSVDLRDTIDRIQVLTSTLTTTGPVYTIAEELRLTARAG